MLEIADIIGIIAFSISGFIIGIKKKLDLLGVILSAYLTALGGGIIRDLLASKKIFAFTSNVYIIVLIVLILGIYFKLHHANVENKTIFIFSDAVGLSSFSISGALVGLDAGFNLFGVVFLSFITAVGGGMIRDMLINEIPFILKEKFYATISIIIGMTIFLLGANFVVLIICLIAGVGLRLIAFYKNWHLPKI
jgi:uncharacterized membrane protein YeiH